MCKNVFRDENFGKMEISAGIQFFFIWYCKCMENVFENVCESCICHEEIF